MKHVAILNVFTHRVHSRSTLTPNWLSAHCTTTMVYCRCPHRCWLRCQVDHRWCFQDSLCSFLSLAIFFIHNDDCKNKNVYLVMGRRVRFQSIWKICIVTGPTSGCCCTHTCACNDVKFALLCQGYMYLHAGRGWYVCCQRFCSVLLLIQDWVLVEGGKKSDTGMTQASVSRIKSCC